MNTNFSMYTLYNVFLINPWNQPNYLAGSISQAKDAQRTLYHERTESKLILHVWLLKCLSKLNILYYSAFEVLLFNKNIHFICIPAQFIRPQNPNVLPTFKSFCCIEQLCHKCLFRIKCVTATIHCTLRTLRPFRQNKNIPSKLCTKSWQYIA